jgi:hypothetical protein
MNKNEYKCCKECGRALPKGRSFISQAARELGYCRYCYRMNVSDASDRYKQENLSDETMPDFAGLTNAEVFNPDEPWNWYEYYFPERDR